MRSDWLIVAVVTLAMSIAGSGAFVARAEDPGYALQLPGNTPVITIRPTRAMKRAEKYSWFELTDAQYGRLVVALKSWHPDRPVVVLSATADSLPLAEDFDTAFGDAGIKSSIDRPMDVVDGLHVTNQALADIITAATGIKLVVDPEEPGADMYVMNFGRKVK